MTEYELTKGVALVLVGSAGSGKTKLAHEIAQRYGRVRNISGFGLNNPIGLRRALRDRPDVLIVDQVPDAEALHIVKSLLVDKFIDCVTGSPRIVLRANTPTYVICTCSPHILPIDKEDRQFRIVEGNGQQRGRDEIEAENAELRDMLVAAYRELQRHGVQSVPLDADPAGAGEDVTVEGTWRYHVDLTVSGVPEGFCPSCQKPMVHDVDEPFASCDCGTAEWPVQDWESAPPVLHAQWIAYRRGLHNSGPLDPKEYTPVHNAVLRFLWGTAPYNGLWFHEAGAQAHGSYWWRKYLPKPEGGEDG